MNTHQEHQHRDRETRKAIPAFRALALAGSLAALGACTQLPNNFRLQQQNETFSTSQQVNTQIDLLWVVDNSASMDTSQKKLREGFKDFALTYLKPTWDIRIAVITTDTYLGHANWSTFLSGKVPGSVNGASTYINTQRSTSWVNPSTAVWPLAFYDIALGRFNGNGLMQKEMLPAYNRKYSLLESGPTAVHDGPITSLCSEASPYFLWGRSNCMVRDNPTTASDRDVSRCLDPLQNSEEQCVNTVQNDGIHTGKAILNTMPPAGTPGDAAWVNQLVADFMVNASTGTTGSGSERGFQSVLQLLADNEKASSTTKFFRPGSIRAIVFLTDEDDQSMAMPVSGEQPFQNYQCDYDQIYARNGANTYCCASGCTFPGTAGVTHCTAKTTPDGTITTQVGICPKPAKLITEDSVKTSLDAFFSSLDSGGAPNYFVTAIIPLTKSTIQSLQSARDSDDTAIKSHLPATMLYDTIDYAERYKTLIDKVGNGSQALDIGASSYKPVLDAIGNAIISKRGTFTLQRVPTSEEDMLVTLVHADGTSQVIPSDKYAIVGQSIVINDLNLILSFASTDSIAISYQPKSIG